MPRPVRGSGEIRIVATPWVEVPFHAGWRAGSGRGWGKELWDGALVATRPGQELDRPLSHALMRDMPIDATLGFVDVLTLSHKRERLLGPVQLLRRGLRLLVGRECIEVVVPVRNILGALARVAPDAVLQDFVPDVAAARMGTGGVVPDHLWVDRGWEGHDRRIPRGWSRRWLCRRSDMALMATGGSAAERDVPAHGPYQAQERRHPGRSDPGWKHGRSGNRAP